MIVLVETRMGDFPSKETFSFESEPGKTIKTMTPIIKIKAKIKIKDFIKFYFVRCLRISWNQFIVELREWGRLSPEFQFV